MKKSLLLLLILAFTASLNAQTSDKKWGIGVGLGGYGTLNNGGIGLMPEFYLGRYLSPRLDIVLKGDAGLFNSNLVNKLDLVNPFINLKYKFSAEDSKLHPYLFAGPGYLYNNRTEAVNFDAGLGAKYYIAQNSTFYMEAGYIHGLESTTYNGITDRENLWKVTAGVEFDFGKAKDTDLDGIADNKDLCPETPAGVNVDNKGCPVDTDGDGVADYMDDCPTLKGLASLKGCPEKNRDVTLVAEVVAPEVIFTVNAPLNIPNERRVRETFPIRNYVFFDLGSTEIPDRYVLITKSQVKDFKEDRLEVFKPKHLSGRSDRQMTVYYNVLNILGERMNNNPSANVRLSGASMQGTEDGMAMAESVKQYLVTVFGIKASRFTTEGRIKPRIPSEQPGTTSEFDLLREGDRRVSIWSESPAILMEYQTGTDTPLKPVELLTLQEAPIDSYVTFNARGAEEAFLSWSLEIKDEQGNLQNFGPYTQNSINLPGKTILGTRPEGNFKVAMVGQTKSGKTIKKETPVHMVLWTPAKDEEGIRFSVIFEFNDSKSISTYEKYLTDIVAPKIPLNGTVILHGHTDKIGEEVYNLNLSLERANDVKTILGNALAEDGRTDVKFEVKGFGEDQALAPFENDFPEERFYNRTVIIDVIPVKPKI